MKECCKDLEIKTPYVKGDCMVEAKFVCPECSAIVVTTRPDCLLWERCPACGSHVWDIYDLMMAEVVKSRAYYRQYQYEKSSVRIHTQ
jgi:hypothetical protein